jgi:hypothetical protein
MTIQLTCTCGRKLKIKDEFGGQEGQCPACGATLMIPMAGEVPELPRAEPSPITDAESELRSDQEIPLAPKRRENREPEDLTNHAGGPLPVSGDYFVDAPREIGKLVSAYTTLREGQRPWSIGARVLISLLCMFAGFCLAVVVDLVFDLLPDCWGFFWMVVLPAGALLIAIFATKFSHTVTYVGEEGVARYCCSGNRDNVNTKEVFLFRDATHLRTTTTHHYRRGVYQNTTYAYAWTDVGGRKRYDITGTHTSKQNTPPATDYFHYARGAELAWTMYLLDQANRQVDLAGGVSFPLKGRQSIRLCPGKIIFYFKEEEPIEWDAEDVGDAVIHEGQVKLKRIDAKEGWFSSTGVMKFPFDSLANAQLFFHLLEKLIGIEAR